MIFGAGKRGVINNVHLIKMVRKIQKGGDGGGGKKKAIIKILLVTLQYVACHWLCCFSRRPLKAALSNLQLHQHGDNFIPSCTTGKTAFRNLWDGSSSSFSSFSASVLHPHQDKTLMDININSLLHTQTLCWKRTRWRKGNIHIFWSNKEHKSSMSWWMNTPQALFHCPGVVRKGHSHPVFIFGAACSESLALTAQGELLEGHTRSSSENQKRQGGSAQTLPYQSSKVFSSSVMEVFSRLKPAPELVQMYFFYRCFLSRDRTKLGFNTYNNL